MTIVRLVLLALAVQAAGTAVPQELTPQAIRELYQAATKAYEQKNYSEYLQKIETLSNARPVHPILLRRLAGAYALNDRPEDAARVLRRMAALTLYHDATGDPDFSRVRTNSAVRDAIGALVPIRTRRIGASEIAWTIDDRMLIPEGVTYDPVTRAFFVSSQYRRKIVRIDPSGTAQDFITSGRDGVWMIFGMAVDPERRLLWAVSAAEPVMQGFTKADEHATGIFAYDLSSGRLVRRCEFSERTAAHRFDDLTVARDGRVFASDAGAGAVYTIAPGATALDALVAPGVIQGPNGLTTRPDGGALYVSDYAGYIFRVDTASKAVTRMPAPADVALYGIDGLAWYKGSLIGVQNGVEPSRVLRLDLSTDGARIDAVRIVDMNHPRVAEPTLGVVVGDSFYYVANSFGGVLRQAKTPLAEQPLAEPAILKITLN